LSGSAAEAGRAPTKHHPRRNSPDQRYKRIAKDPLTEGWGSIAPPNGATTIIFFQFEKNKDNLKKKC
jgi:hypothetical protein